MSDQNLFQKPCFSSDMWYVAWDMIPGPTQSRCVWNCSACILEQRGKPTGKQHWSVKAKNNSSSSGWSAKDDKMKLSDVQRCSDEESAASPSDSSILWVDHHKPTNLREIIGQQGDKSSARKLYVWLSNWRDNFWKKPVCECLTYCHAVCHCVRTW